MSDPYAGLHLYYGDLHSHCAVGYGHGSAEDAFRNARLQLDFACVTAHAWWPDMPPADAPGLGPTVAYHRRGFTAARDNWSHLRAVVAANHEPGAFVPFLGFEWHSLAYGDHHVVYEDEAGEILPAPDLPALRAALRQGTQRALLVPHHIGYRRGYRGINWDAYTEEFSPVVEIMSMHGCSESDDAPYPMLHTMGPRDGESLYAHGLQRGHRVGAVGSTDHHSAHPGSYGHGRLGVWARSLTRGDLLDAIYARRCYALTGDRIALRLSVNEVPMGGIAPADPHRAIIVEVDGGAALDTVEVLRNEVVIYRWIPSLAANDDPSGSWLIPVEFGWGPKGEEADWRARIDVREGRLLGVEPRLRGQDIVAPQGRPPPPSAFSDLIRREGGVSLTTKTWGNPATSTPGTQAFCLLVDGDANTRLACDFNGAAFEVYLGELAQHSRSGYLGGFLTPAWRIGRAVPQTVARVRLTLHDRVLSPGRDCYRIRVRQANEQWAWSSPVWVAAPP
jgi:hypothetical protein